MKTCGSFRHLSIGLLCWVISGMGLFSQVNVNLSFNTDFTWKALSATPNGGFLSVGGSNAWMLNSFNAAAWPNAIAGSWAIGGIYDLPAVQHIWNNVYNDSVLLRKEFVVPVADSYTGAIQSQVDNQYSLYFNGTLLGAGTYNPTPVANYNIAPSLQGCVNNVVAMEARNWGGPYGAKMAINITAVNVLNSPVANVATNITCNSFTAHWDTVATADLYLVDVSTDPLFNTFYSIYHDYNAGPATSLNLAALPGPGPYYYRLRAQRTNAAGLRISCYSNVITVNLAPQPGVDAGFDAQICPSSTTNLNGSGVGTVSWSPAAGLSATNILNPTVTPLATTTYTLTITNAGCTSVDSVTISIANLPTLQLSNDTVLCSGGCATLSVNGGDYFEWASFPGMIDSSLTTQTVCPSATTTYAVKSYTVGPNVITNGNFSAGNSGFVSSYNYAFPNTTEGEYFVGTNPQAWNGGLSPCGDHTSGSGNMMMVNGSPIPNTSIWCQNVPISTNTDYLFSTWVTPAYAVNMPILQFSINNIPVGSTFSPNGPNCNWEEFFTTWNSGISTSANICIVNQNTNVSGNDFALDDISFSPVCTQVGSVTVTVDSLPVALATNTGPYCTGNTIQLNSPAGSASDDWVGPAGYVQNDTQNPALTGATLAMAGIYTVTVTNASGCSATATTSVLVNTSATVVAANTGPYCVGDTLALTASSGSLTYDWAGPNGYTQANTQNPTIPASTAAMSGVYTVTATAAGGCTGSSTTVVVVNVLPVVNAQINAPICNGSLINLQATGALNYNWVGPNGFIAANIASPQIMNCTFADSGIYLVVGTDLNGCSSTASIVAVVFPTPSPLFSADITTGCTPLCVNFTDNSSIAGSTITGWNWTIESQTSSTNSNVSPCFSNPGLYDASLTVTSAEGCSATAQIANYINVVASPVAEFTYAPQTISFENPTVNFVNTSFASTGYVWDFGDGGSSTLMNNQHTYSDTGTYCVYLLANNSLGCTDTVVHCLVVNPVFNLYIPNSFTPNGDGLNDQFMAYGRGIKTLEVFIYNRWGQEVYHFSDIEKGWPGNMQAGNSCPMGVYVYKINAVDFINNVHEFVGMVNLIR